MQSIAEPLATKNCVERANKAPIEVMLFVPDVSISEFWQSTLSFAEAVSLDLNINLNTVILDESARNRFGFQRLIKKKLSESQRPDFILTIMYGGGEYVQLNTFNNMNIPFITFNSSLGPFELRVTKRPRDYFKFWKAHMSHREFLAGAQVVSDLIAYKGGSTLAILGGATNSVVNMHRIEGAVKGAKAASISVLAPVFTDWSTREGLRATQTLFRRAPEIDMIWTAGPELAVGASQALALLNRSASIGSFDWAGTNFQQIKKGELAFSYGGHFTEAGWAMVLIYDFLHGVDFQDELGTIVQSNLKRVDRTNVNEIEVLSKERLWKNTDFAKYTKCLNLQRKTYDFALTTN